MAQRILILTAGFGEGHNAAARGIRDGLAVVAAERAAASVVELHDIFAETFGLANDLVRRGYLALINRLPDAWSKIYDWVDRDQAGDEWIRVFFLARQRLRALLESFRPDVVVSVFPAYTHLFDQIYGDQPAPFQRVVCITDSISVNAIWTRGTCDCFLVPNDETAAVLAATGIESERVRVTGFPVTPKFAELGILREPPSDSYGRRILYMINAGRLLAPEIIRGLAGIAGTRLTVTIGRNKNLRRAAEAARAEAGRKFEIVGWTDQLPRLMLESHLLISKAGGATVQETIAAGCPMIINQIVPGQEAGNARLIQGTHSGVIATTPETIVGAVREAFADNGRVWNEWSENIRRLSRPRASLEIAEFLLAL